MLSQKRWSSEALYTCAFVMQTRDIIEEMAAADQQQKGWHSTRSVIANRRFLQVILPYCRSWT